MKKKRSAVALLITLSVIASMLALMGVMFGYLSTMQKKAEVKASAFQANLLRDDIGTLLKQILGKSPSKNKMKLLFRTPLAIASTNGEFSMSVACQPIANRINIAWILAKKGKNSQNKQALARSLFGMLVNRANLRDPSLLRQKVISAIKQENSTIFGIKRRLKEKKAIITYNRFKKIVDDYRFEEDDSNVYKIDWNSYFSFGIRDEFIDGDFITPKLLAFLYGVDINVVKEGLKFGDLESSLNEIGGFSKKKYKWLFAPKAVPEARCDVDYTFRKGNYNFRFDYMSGRIEDFKFFDN